MPVSSAAMTVVVLRVSADGLRILITSCETVMLLEGTHGRAICKVECGELDCSPRIVAAAGVELRPVIGEGERMAGEERLEAGAGGCKMHGRRAVVSGGTRHVGKAP